MMFNVQILGGGWEGNGGDGWLRISNSCPTAGRSRCAPTAPVRHLVAYQTSGAPHRRLRPVRHGDRITPVRTGATPFRHEMPAVRPDALRRPRGGKPVQSRRGVARIAGQRRTVAGRASRRPARRSLHDGVERRGRRLRRGTSAACRFGDEGPLPPLRARQPPDPPRRIRSRHRPYPSAPEGGTASAALFSMHAEYALYPCDADTVRLTIRNAGRQRLCFGTDYAVCRLHGDRWERLPDGGMWHSLLICLEPENGTAEHRFTARLHLAPLSGRIRPLPHLQTGLHRTPPPRLSVDGRVHRHALRPLHPFRPIGVCGADFAPSRRKFPIVITLYILAFIIASLLYRRRHRHIDMRTVRRLELERYMGRWYENRPLRPSVRTAAAQHRSPLHAAGRRERRDGTGRHRHPHRTPAHVVPARPANATERTAAGEKTSFSSTPITASWNWTISTSGRSWAAPHRCACKSSRQPRIRRDTLRHIVGLAERRGYPLDRLRLLRAPQ